MRVNFSMVFRSQTHFIDGFAILLDSASPTIVCTRHCGGSVNIVWGNRFFFI
jgi:hypothetical protein